MAKKAFVLSCLKVLGLQEMLKLSEVAHTHTIALKKVSGGGVVSDAQEEKPKSKPKKEEKEGKVLPFPQKSKTNEDEDAHDLSPPLNPSDLRFLASDEILKQLEITKDKCDTFQKHRAIEEYKQNQNVHIVKIKDGEGRVHVRFAKTKGVLIDRKLA